MDYLITIPKEGNASLILALLKELNVKIQPKTDSDDWWNDLPQSVKDDHVQGEKEGEEGKAILLEDFLKKYN